MSPVTEAQDLFIDHNANKYPFYGIIYTQSRRVGKSRLVDVLTEESKKVISRCHTEWWDEKMTNESLYASSDTERFKQDKLPLIIKRLNS